MNIIIESITAARAWPIIIASIIGFLALAMAAVALLMWALNSPLLKNFFWEEK